jgi:hypothetical protein
MIDSFECLEETVLPCEHFTVNLLRNLLVTATIIMLKKFGTAFILKQ